MVARTAITSALDAEFSFYQGSDKSKNGLQVKGSKTVAKVAVACDASIETIQMSRDAHTDFLIVHHGLLWEGQDPRKKDVLFQRRLKEAQKAGLNVYAQHLPLDAHPVLGNNVLLAKRLGLSGLNPACPYEGANVAFKGGLKKPVSLDAFAKMAKKKVGAVYKTLPFGTGKVHKVAVCSGSGGFCSAFAQMEGFDTLVVGEFKHSDYHEAKEYGVNVIEAGHYNTEVLGVQAVGRWIEEKFGIPFVFLDSPTGF